MLWRLPALRWLSVTTFFYSFVQLCLGSFLVIMLVEEIGYTLVAAGMLLSVTQGAGVIARVIWA